MVSRNLTQCFICLISKVGNSLVQGGKRGIQTVRNPGIAPPVTFTRGRMSSEKPLSTTGSNEDVADTPLDFLISFLTQLKSQSASVPIPESMRTLINQSHKLAAGFREYPVKMSTELSVDAKLLAQKTKDFDYAALHSEGKTGKFKFFKEMSSDEIQGRILKMLVKMTGAKSVLEVGTFTGFAALNMAEALPRDGRLVTMEFLPFFAQFVREFMDQTVHGKKIDIREGPAIELLKAAGEIGEQFDFIFVDAAKPEYKDYLSIILDNHLLAPKGSLLFDNTIYKGATYMENFPQPHFARGGPILHEFNQIVLNEPRIEQVILPIRDGVTIIRWIGE